MNKFRILILMAVAMLTGATFTSCSTDDDSDYWYYNAQNMPNALVTVKVDGDSCFFQLDDSTSLRPINIQKPYGDKEVRALVNYTVVGNGTASHGQEVRVNWMDSILTKKPVPCLATAAENDNAYGHDAVDIVRDWVTVVEDGYLTLRFRALWGNVKAHSINLLVGGNPNNPYEVELRHNTNGDPQLRWGDALVAFNLNQVLPDTHGKKVKLTIKWKSTAGDKSVDFDYTSRPSVASQNMLKGFVLDRDNVIR